MRLWLSLNGKFGKSENLKKIMQQAGVIGICVIGICVIGISDISFLKEIERIKIWQTADVIKL